jgi:hypothetical protein
VNPQRTSYAIRLLHSHPPHFIVHPIFLIIGISGERVFSLILCRDTAVGSEAFASLFQNVPLTIGKTIRSNTFSPSLRLKRYVPIGFLLTEMNPSSYSKKQQY